MLEKAANPLIYKSAAFNSFTPFKLRNNKLMEKMYNLPIKRSKGIISRYKSPR